MNSGWTPVFLVFKRSLQEALLAEFPERKNSRDLMRLWMHCRKSGAVRKVSTGCQSREWGCLRLATLAKSHYHKPLGPRLIILTTSPCSQSSLESRKYFRKKRKCTQLPRSTVFGLKAARPSSAEFWESLLVKFQAIGSVPHQVSDKSESFLVEFQACQSHFAEFFGMSESVVVNFPAWQSLYGEVLEK